MMWSLGSKNREGGLGSAAPAASAAFVQPSPTVNTKEAFRLAQGMWREESVREETPQPPPPPQPKNPAFPIYSDENSANPPPPSASKAPFAVFQVELQQSVFRFTNKYYRHLKLHFYGAALQFSIIFRDDS